jgi:hypothetical protein
VAIDIGKAFHAVLVERPDGAQQRFRMANSAEDYGRLVTFLRTLPGTVPGGARAYRQFPSDAGVSPPQGGALGGLLDGRPSVPCG